MAETKGLPYGCDYAKTSRSICKDANCRSEIEKHHLRMAVRTHSHFSEGLQDNWFHFGCFWKRARQDINEAEIRGFEHLKWSDQERIRERIALKDGRIFNDSNLNNFNLENPDEIKPTRNAMVEYAKSGKSSCMKCKQTLKSNELRIEFHSSYYHPKCLAEKHTYKKMAEK
jgi:poly [ADP-ribose] polymerase